MTDSRYRPRTMTAPSSTADAPAAAAPPAARVLIADDQNDVLEAIRLLLKSEGYVVEAARSPNEILVELQSRDFAALLMDLN